MPMADKKPLHHLYDEIQEVKKVLPIGSIRSHRKHPENHYRIEDIVIYEAEDVPMVIYKPLYGDREVLLSRVVTIFLEQVEKDGKMVGRFERVR